MAATVFFYNTFKHAIGNAVQSPIDLDGDTFKIALVQSTYTPDIDAHDFFDDITNEASGTNYTAGGNTLATKTWTQDNGNDRAVWDFDDPTFTNVSISFRYAVIYRSTGTASTSRLIGYIDYGGTQTVVGADVVVPINAAGFMAIRQAP